MSKAVLRTLAVVETLKGQTLHGLSNREIADAIGDTPVNISRALADLTEAGWVRKLESGRYAHTVKLLQIAQAHANEMSQAQSRIQEINQRVLAGSLR